MNDIWETLLSLWHLFPFYVEAFSECYTVHKQKQKNEQIQCSGEVMQKYYSMKNFQHFF